MIAAVLMVLVGSLSQLSAETYVDTSGSAISEDAIGDYCRPIEKLADGRLMVFSTSAQDIALYKDRLAVNGVSDPVEMTRMVQMAELNDCERKAGNKCSDGKCASGSCKQKFTGGMTSCSCQ